MKKFYVIWTYIGNYSNVMELFGNTAEDILKSLYGFYSEDFKKKANIYIFENPPILQVTRKD